MSSSAMDVKLKSDGKSAEMVASKDFPGSSPVGKVAKMPPSKDGKSSYPDRVRWHPLSACASRLARIKKEEAANAKNSRRKAEPKPKISLQMKKVQNLVKEARNKIAYYSPTVKTVPRPAPKHMIADGIPRVRGPPVKPALQRAVKIDRLPAAAPVTSVPVVRSSEKVTAGTEGAYSPKPSRPGTATHKSEPASKAVVQSDRPPTATLVTAVTDPEPVVPTTAFQSLNFPVATETGAYSPKPMASSSPAVGLHSPKQETPATSDRPRLAPIKLKMSFDKRQWSIVSRCDERTSSIKRPISPADVTDVKRPRVDRMASRVGRDLME